MYQKVVQENKLPCMYQTRGICIKRLSIKINYLICIKRVAYVSEGGHENNLLYMYQTGGVCIRRLSMKLNFLKCIKRVEYVSEGGP